MARMLQAIKPEIKRHIEKLIMPYLKTEITTYQELEIIVEQLKERGYLFQYSNIINRDYIEVSIKDISTKEKDYFKVNKYSGKIDEIIRGIK
jgi:hypothetical protein